MSHPASVRRRTNAFPRIRLSSMPSFTAENHLLAALARAGPAASLRRLEPVSLARGEPLADPGVAPRYAYFPTTAVVSLLHRSAEGAGSEVAVIGNDGVVGLAIVLGGGPSGDSPVVRQAGDGFRLDAESLVEACAERPAMLRTLLLYTRALMVQISQTAFCNRRHSLSQQLCRHLLLTLDRLPDNVVASTHAQIATLLGVRRGGVTESALELRDAGLIRYERGRITVLDRRRLEQRSCECYAIVEREAHALRDDASGPGRPVRRSA